MLQIDKFFLDNIILIYLMPGTALTLADFYVCDFENKILETQPDLEPIIYCIYLDKIFGFAKNADHVLKLRHLFTNDSFLNFT